MFLAMLILLPSILNNLKAVVGIQPSTDHRSRSAPSVCRETDARLQNGRNLSY
jgi:hypothetical protein